jgi:hypothetical protein
MTIGALLGVYLEKRYKHGRGSDYRSVKSLTADAQCSTAAKDS